MKKLAILCAAGLDNFLAWVPCLEDEYETKVFRVRSMDDLLAGVRWGDILWCEWANEVAAHVTAAVKHGTVSSGTKIYLGGIYVGDKPVIVRLHSYETLQGGLVEGIQWDVVKKCVFVAPHMLDITKRRYGYDWDRIAEVVPNGIDLDAIPFLDPPYGQEIAVVGGINNKKNPGLVLQVLDALMSATNDRTWRVVWAGAFQELRYEIYLRHMVSEMGLTENVHFCGNLSADEMKNFWHGKNFLLHTSVHEGHCYSIMEAMARGIPPFIHNYYGAKDQYRGAIGGMSVFNTPEDICNRLWYFRSDPTNRLQYRHYVEENGWTLGAQVTAFRRIIHDSQKG